MLTVKLGLFFATKSKAAFSVKVLHAQYDTTLGVSFFVATSYVTGFQSFSV